MSLPRPGIGRKVVARLPLAGGGTALVEGVVTDHLTRDLHVELERSDKSRFVMTLPPSEVVEMLTPSEVALAKVLAAWDAWSGTDGEGEAHEAWLAVALVLGNKGYASGSSLMPVGRALVDRARKAGVL